MRVLWCVFCLLLGYFAGDVGRSIVATAGLAASQAVDLGIVIGFISGTVLEGVYVYKIADKCD